MTENTLEQIDKETLVLMVKEKGKEIKVLEGKNKKLEERYVKIFKDNKNLNKDRETLEKLLQIIFYRNQERFANVELGNYEFNSLTKLWDQFEDEKIKLFNETLESHKNKNRELEGKILLFEGQLERLRNEKEHAVQTENANKKLSQQIKDLNNLLEEKNKEIIDLKKAEDEVDKMRTEVLLREIEIKNACEEHIKEKFQESERKNELLRLRQELEEAKCKIKGFESEKQIVQLCQNSQSTQTEMEEEDLPTLVCERKLRSGEHSRSTSPGSLSRRRDSECFSSASNEDGHINQEYLKNVILKLFCYIEGNNMKEVKIIMNAISIILNMSREDKEKIEEARKNNTVLKNTIHFLKDTFTNKGEVNYYTRNYQK